MKKTVICFLGSLILSPLGAQAQEVDGLWIPTSKPGYNITAVDGPANDPDEALGISILGPNFTTWGIFYGIKTGEVTADLIPSITNSDMRARWSTSGLTGTLQIQSCTRNCPFNAGETIDLVKVFGNGVYPPDSPPSPALEITPGLWTGEGVCFFVNAEGTKLIENELCDNGQSFAAEIPGVEVDIDGRSDVDVCNANVACGGVWDIIDDNDNQGGVTVTRATCSNEFGGIGEVIFDSGTMARVRALEGQDLDGRICYGPDTTAVPTQ